jgi:hypothetical protein
MLAETSAALLDAAEHPARATAAAIASRDRHVLSVFVFMFFLLITTFDTNVSL